MTHEEYALQCERNGNLKENYVYVARERDRLKEENEELRRQVTEAPPERHGEWRGKFYSGLGFTCSACSANIGVKTPFCPHCGAKMDGGGENHA